MPTAEEKFDRLLKNHKEYDEKAYDFIYDALDYTLKNIGKIKVKNQHVSVEELSQGFRLHAIDQFGCLAKTVLNEWGIKTTRDIGNIVFNLIDYNLMGMEPFDTKEQFNDLYNFKEVFNLKPIVSYLPKEDRWIISYIPKNRSLKENPE